MSRFAGRIAVVTGGSRGIGRQVALELAAEGALVVVGCRTRVEEAEEVAAAIAAAGGRAEVLPLDVRDGPAVGEALRELARRHGRIDVLVNNAGIVRDALYPMMGPQEWEQVLAVDLGGAHHCCRAVLPGMIARRRGAIVNVASLAGIRASVGQANYAAAKGGLIALTRTLAAEAAPRGVRVNCVVPGLIDAGMTARLDRNHLAERLARVPLGRLGTAGEAARAVLFLASEDASYVTGQALVVDGGLSL